MKDDDKIPFTAHLEELRERLIKCFIAISIGFCIAYGFKEYLFEILKSPLGDTEFITTAIQEGFFTYLKVAFLTGLLTGAPVILYQFWMFVAPGLYNKERRLLAPIVALSSFFFVGGALFGYFVVFPFGFKFLLSVTPSTIIPRLSMKEYLNFSSKLLLAFGLVFELPLVITFMAKLGIVSVDFLKKNRKYAILLFFVGSALLTPPDVVTQVMMALPLMLLYEISIIGARIFGRKNFEEEEDEETSDLEKT
ncbi:MAG: twin-arginine translocase subunit TatC [Desulfobacteraceae bacterium]|nr:twin-arginine translocase subunit TatC [Desulfobacteraceae bacterium]